MERYGGVYITMFAAVISMYIYCDELSQAIVWPLAAGGRLQYAARGVPWLTGPLLAHTRVPSVQNHNTRELSAHRDGMRITKSA